MTFMHNPVLSKKIITYALVREAKVRAVGGGEALSGDGDLHLPQHLGGRGEKN